MQQLTTRPAAMSSREIGDLLDTRHDSVKRTIERLAEKDLVRFTPSVETSHEGAGSRPVEVYLVNERDSYVVVAQLSPEFTARLVDYWQEHKNEPAQIPTTAEAFAQAFRMLADAEQRDAARDRRLNLIDAKVERIETAQTVLRARPANSESIAHLRKRIWGMFGLSDQTIDAVMRQSPIAPKPAGMVRNDRAEAEGSTYAVYWKKDVTKVFEVFTRECRAVTDHFFTHPFIEGRFKMARRE
ncbi:Rha family transcriptional regulator [Rhizobium leguminosarum]|uniref:Rha family transcriptional regulator n=1 Tax=Rhizobium leguminosarum TaxID=384 RepID=UPI00197DE68C|nr:Rha family transcriptional regulator [Rhizobium leguminosarum]